MRVAGGRRRPMGPHRRASGPARLCPCLLLAAGSDRDLGTRRLAPAGKANGDLATGVWQATERGSPDPPLPPIRSLHWLTSSPAPAAEKVCVYVNSTWEFTISS
ncbi:hypothetical protein BS78_06G050700 [Paspalum vaginatum]|nr:hypothetical protein BS78_06G050700 [Paspalum vaginatum]KAJ1270417.1 hypothetical protein BS78_06G050700 [Paspalum vaginatum]